MRTASDAEPAWFGFRTGHGRIGAKTWWQGTAFLGVSLAVLTLIWFRLAPFVHRDLATTLVNTVSSY